MLRGGRGLQVVVLSDGSDAREKIVSKQYGNFGTPTPAEESGVPPKKKTQRYINTRYINFLQPHLGAQKFFGACGGQALGVSIWFSIGIQCKNFRRLRRAKYGGTFFLLG